MSAQNPSEKTSGEDSGGMSVTNAANDAPASSARVGGHMPRAARTEMGVAKHSPRDLAEPQRLGKLADQRLVRLRCRLERRGGLLRRDGGAVERRCGRRWLRWLRRRRSWPQPGGEREEMGLQNLLELQRGGRIRL